MKLRELFYSDYYNIAFRQKEDDDASSDREWTVVQSSNHEWFADPFLFEKNGRLFLFAERMNVWQTKGTIACCEILENASLSRFKEVLVEPFHLSYPNVFEYNGNIYMIPETGHSNDIRIYKSGIFPEQWELEKVLFTGANFVDTSFVSEIKDRHAILYSFDWDTKSPYYYNFDLEQLTLSELPKNPKMLNERSGGNYFERDGKKYRVLQDCSRTYGEKVLINRIDCCDFEGGNASDSLSVEILPQNLVFNIHGIRSINCHTYNQTAHYEVIDFLAERFVWFQPFIILRRKIRSAYHKVIRKMYFRS